jgi:hypothetical protein
MSRFFSGEHPEKEHLLRGGGLAHEILDLREDVGRAFDSVETAIGSEVSDDRLPRLSYGGPTLVDIIPIPGNPSASAVILMPDKSFRVLSFPVSFNPSSVGPGGLDVGSEAPSTFYYLYAVPTNPTGDVLHIRGSVNPPTVGPTGFSVSRYLGAIYNDSSSDILPFLSRGSKVRLASAQIIQQLSGVGISTEGSPVAVDLSAFVPLTAGAVILEASLKGTGGADGMVELYINGFQSFNSHLQIQSTDTEWNFEIAEFETPGTPKKIYRRFEEFVGNLDTFCLLCLGWVDEWLE